jgi:hypothetical protein
MMWPLTDQYPDGIGFDTGDDHIKGLARLSLNCYFVGFLHVMDSVR